MGAHLTGQQGLIKCAEEGSKRENIKRGTVTVAEGLSGAKMILSENFASRALKAVETGLIPAATD